MLRCPVHLQWFQPPMWCKSWESAGPWTGVCTSVSTCSLLKWLLRKLENSVVSFAVIKTAVKLAFLVTNQSGSNHSNGP